MLPEAIEELRNLFGERMTTDPMECRLYSHDVGVMPDFVKPLLRLKAAEAIVQPKSEAELVSLVLWSAKYKVPLTPRGKATSGYGGAVPYRGGVVVDFLRLRSITSINHEAMTVTVAAGAIWEAVERAIAKEGLALRLYPSSAKSSTVGGWLAQGGYGYGSYEYNSFTENVISARIVQPSGEILNLSGSILTLVSDAEGITGLISQVTIRLRPLEEEIPLAITFSKREDVLAAIAAVTAAKLPLWSLTMSNAAMNKMRNQMPEPLTHTGQHQASTRAPQGYLMLAVFPASRTSVCQQTLLAIAATHNGQYLGIDISGREWTERYNVMDVKRLAPSLIPFEVRLPLAGLADTLRDVETKLAMPVMAEVMIAGGETHVQAIILGFMPHDQRKLTYNIAFGASSSALTMAKQHGGQVYTTGLYFAHEAENVLGSERVSQLRQFKQANDPNNLLNPGKVISSPAFFSALLKTAGVFEPLARKAANLMTAPVGERFQTKRGIPGDVAWYAYACAQCGRCVDECDEFYGRGWESHSPRGKWYFLREVMEGRANFDQSWTDKFLACTTCEYCNVRCPLELPIEPAWLAMRGKLIDKEKRMTFPPFEMMAASLRQEKNIWANMANNRSDWLDEATKQSLPEKAELAYFAGCTASFVEQDIARGTMALLHKAGIEMTYLGNDEACCGIPMLISGKWDVFKEIMQHNISAMKAKGVKTVITSCPACWLAWHTYYPEWAKKLGINFDIQAKHYSEVLAEAIEDGKLHFDGEIPMTVTYHDPCHMGRAGGIYEPPRQVLQAIPGINLVEMEHNRELGHCCGSVLTLISEPSIAQKIGEVRIAEAEAAGAEAIVAACPCCEVQLRVTTKGCRKQMPVLDLASLAARSLGVNLPDPTAYALEMWSIFDGMIKLMSPAGMAELMRSLFPQMFATMPPYMLTMMKAAKRIPGMLSVMKPIMPRMLPLLMPMVMPKVLPDMLEAIKKSVPMPNYMQELMSQLMPSVMNNLMPNMLPLIAPTIVPEMIGYIKQNL